MDVSLIKIVKEFQTAFQNEKGLFAVERQKNGVDLEPCDLARESDQGIRQLTC